MTTQDRPTSYLSGLSPVLTIDEVASLLRLKRRSVTRMLQTGRLIGSKLTRSGGTAGRRLILRESVERLIAAGMDEPRS